MSKPDIFIETAILSTREKLPDRILESGKIGGKDPADAFLFYIVELSPQSDSTVVAKIVSTLQNNLKAAPVLTPDVFENVLSLINQALGKLSETSDSLWIGNLSAAIGLIDNEELLISQTGKATGYIFRKNKISSLTDQPDSETPPQPSRTFTDITSGIITPGDKLVFGSNELFNHVSVDRLRNFAKSDNITTSAIELKRYLRRARIDGVNSVFIEVTPELPEQNHDEIIFLDEPEDTTLKIAARKIAPIIEQIKITSREILRTSAKNGAKLAEKWHASWLEKYQPRGKKLIKRSRDKIREGLSSSRQKIEELNYDNDNPAHLKIRANSYLKSDKKSFSLEPVWRKIYPPLRTFFSRKNRRLIIAIIFILILIFSYVKIKIKNSNKERALHQIQVASAYDQALALFKTAKEESESGNTSLDNFYRALTLAQTAKEDKANLERADALIKQINSVVDDKTATNRFYDAKNYSLADSVSKIILVGFEIYGLDSNNKIYSFDTRDHQPKLVGSLGTDSGKVSDFYYSETSSKILFDTDSKKTFSFDLAKSVVSSLSNADSNSEWKGTTAIATYASNIYTLDSDTGAIWKYTAAGTGYSKATVYSNTKTVSIKGAIDMAIDGNVFVLKNDGTITKFVKGAPEPDFALKGIPAPYDSISAPAQLFTDDTTNSIFVLDKKYNRIIKFDKSGQFNSQYVFNDVTLDCFVVDAKLQKIWGLAGGKIYEGNL